MVETLTYAGTDTSGESYPFSQTLTTSSVARVSKQKVMLTTAVAPLIVINAAEDGDAFSSISKIVIKNMSTSLSAVTIGRLVSAGDEIYESLPVGAFMVINTVNLDAATAGGGFGAFTSLTSVVAFTPASTATIEVYVFRT